MKYCIYNSKQFLLFNFFISTTGLTDLILNSIHSSRISSDSIVAVLWSHRKIVVWFPVGTSSPVTGLEWPRGFQEVKVPRFHDNGTGWW
jgi:hypothetical protein